MSFSAKNLIFQFGPRELIESQNWKCQVLKCKCKSSFLVSESARKKNESCLFAGNFLVIFVVLKIRRMRQSYTNFFLFNMAIADMAVGVLCIIPTFFDFYKPEWLWRLGPVRQTLTKKLFLSILVNSNVRKNNFLFVKTTIYVTYWYSMALFYLKIWQKFGLEVSLFDKNGWEFTQCN